jgi:hypothetical protein
MTRGDIFRELKYKRYKLKRKEERKESEESRCPSYIHRTPYFTATLYQPRKFLEYSGTFLLTSYSASK